MTVAELNLSPAAEQALRRCCGSTRWARLMAAARPFASVDAALVTARVIWEALAPPDWLEALAAHPRIGERTADAWAAAEQAGAASATGDVRAQLAAVNRAYEARFGYIFIVRAAGRTAEEMLAIAEARLKHAPDEELRVAAGEQRDITRLRLMALLGAA